MNPLFAVRACFILALLLGLGALTFAWLGVPAIAAQHDRLITETLQVAAADAGTSPVDLHAEVTRGHDPYRALWLGYGMALSVVAVVGLYFTSFPPGKRF